MGMNTGFGRPRAARLLASPSLSTQLRSEGALLMTGPWARTFNRYLAKGHDHGSAAFAATNAERRASAECPSTHCNRRGECCSPSDCCSQLKQGDAP
jgi:hypothetical protein